MSVRLRNLALELGEPESLLPEKASQQLGLAGEAVVEWHIVRKSVDPRRGRIRFIYTADLAFADAAAESAALESGAVDVPVVERPAIIHGSEEIRGQVVVIGCGPAGLFAALELARHGYRPLLIERGAPVAERSEDVAAFNRGGAFDEDSNILFGAGGAGAFSDGKLRTRVRDPRIRFILEQLVGAGAPESIMIDARPHVGTDRLRGVVENLCAELLALGGRIMWRRRMTGLKMKNNVLRAVAVGREEIETNCCVLATGASARDTFVLLERTGVALEAKPFQMGLRIEHPRELIDRAIYGKYAGHELLGAAEYVLSAAGVTVFCVCPGGVLLAAAAEPATVCTNGMSDAARSSPFTNAALVTTVQPSAFGRGPLDGVAIQKEVETMAFARAGGCYSAPAQNADDFLFDRTASSVRETTYPLGVKAVSLKEIMPASVAAAVGRALAVFDKRIPGFAGRAGVLVGPETRASCPVRVLRDSEGRATVSVDGIYPAGEGSGYSSGIMSSAVDGLKTAEAVMARFAVPACS